MNNDLVFRINGNGITIASRRECWCLGAECEDGCDNCDHLEIFTLTSEQEQLLTQAAMTFGLEALKVVLTANGVNPAQFMPVISSMMAMAQLLGQTQQQPESQRQEIRLFEW